MLSGYRDQRYNRRSVTVTTPPAVRAVHFEEMKNFLRIEEDFSDDDALLAELVVLAEQAVEVYCKRALITQTLKLTMDFFPARSDITLPRCPIQSITSVTTYDQNNDAAVLDSGVYSLDTAGGRLYLNQDGVWPTDLRPRAAAEILYVAGYGSSAGYVPDGLRLAIKTYVSALYDSRGLCEMPSDTIMLLHGYRLHDDLGIL